MSAEIVVRGDRIASNVQAMREHAGAEVLGVVKANGYGHGAIGAARAMLDGGASWLGVVDLREALTLRSAGVTAPILAWIHSASTNFGIAERAGIEVAVSNLAQLEAACAAGCTVHLKVDTGLGRNGIPQQEWQRVFAVAATLQSAGRGRIRGLMTHMAGSGADYDALQLARFGEARAGTAGLDIEVTHVSASAATLSVAERFDLVRVGIAAYGLDPDGRDADGARARALGLKPALRLTASSSAGTVGIGYREGLLPIAGAPVLVAGAPARVASLGARTMQTSSTGSGTAVVIGDPADGEPGAGALAEAAGTINYEVVTRLARSVRRSWTGVSA